MTAAPAAWALIGHPPANKRVPYFSTEATVDVEISPDDLHEAGWHHEHECRNGPGGSMTDDGLPWAPPVSLLEAVCSLHRQAHPGQHPNAALCHEEPCRSLTLDQWRGVPNL